MAEIIVRNARVARVIKGRGFSIVETYPLRNGGTKETKFTVWVDNPSDIPGEGSLVTVQGLYSNRMEKFTNQEGREIEYLALHINQPKITLMDTPQPQVEQLPSDWVKAMTDEAPF